MGDTAVAIFLAVSERAGWLSLWGQLGSLGLALIVGRFFMRSRAVILLVSVLGAVGAMFANILVDGQGAFLFLIFAPLVYAVAVVGRRNLRL